MSTAKRLFNMVSFPQCAREHRGERRPVGNESEQALGQLEPLLTTCTGSPS
jgi:hypothetical protein